MNWHLTTMLPLLALVSWAAVEDMRRGRIPNWLTFSLAAAGLIHSFLPQSGLTPLQSLAGLMVGLLVPFVLFALGAMGAGDVKLFAALGAWLGWGPFLALFALSAAVGAVLLLAQSLWERTLLATLRNTLSLSISLLYIRQLGARQVADMGQQWHSIRKPMPYAIPIWAATLLVLFTPVVSMMTRRLI